MFAGLWFMCMLCDLKIRPSCSDNPATYGSPSIDLRGLLFVLGGLFALGGGGETIPPKSEPTHVTALREQVDGSKRRTHRQMYAPK